MYNYGFGRYRKLLNTQIDKAIICCQPFFSHWACMMHHVWSSRSFEQYNLRDVYGNLEEWVLPPSTTKISMVLLIQRGYVIIIIFHTVQDTFSVYCVPDSTPVPQNPMNAMVMVMVKLILNATSPYPSPLHPPPSPLTPFPHPSYRAAKAHSMRAWYPPPPPPSPPLPMWHLLAC